MGKDYTLHARVDGTVVYRRRRGDRTYVSIRPDDQELAASTRTVVGTKEAATGVAPVVAVAKTRTQPAVEAFVEAAETVTPVAEATPEPIAEPEPVDPAPDVAPESGLTTEPGEPEGEKE